MIRFSTVSAYVVTVFVLLLLHDTAQAQLPFRKKNSRAAAANNRDLTVKNGPWVIMCASFSGESAEESALQLVNELRQHRLSAFLYRHSFDYSGSFQGLGWQEPDKQGNFTRTPKIMKSANLDVVRETAVLVGDFPSPDDGRAQRTLKQIKSLRITSVPGLFKDGTVNPTPLRTAFMLPNPLLPAEYFRRPKIDKFIFKINNKLQYSLLKCPGLYSVRIASFRGDSTVDQGKIDRASDAFQTKYKDGKPVSSSRLLDAEEKAHNLTLALRKKGVEAYEFHDRTESYVCIGSFDWVTRKTNDRVMNNPDIVKLVEACKPEVRNLPGAPNAILPKSVMGITFDPKPTPIMVPKFDRATRTASRLGFLKK